MIIFLYGEDTYRSRQKLNEIIGQYKKIHKSGLNLKYFEGEKLTFQDFQEEFRTASMFKEKKLIIIKNIFNKASNSEFKEKFTKQAARFKDSKNVIVFYENNSIPPNNSFFKFLKKEAKFQEFNFLKGERLKNWAKKEIERHGKEINPQILSQLVYSIGNDLWRFSNEIKKIANYKSKERNIEMSKRDLELLVRPNIEADIFKTIDALAGKDKKRAFYLIHKHLEKGDYPLYLLTMINFQFRNLLTIKTRYQYMNETRMTRISDLAKEIGMHPYVVRKSLAQAAKFSLDELKKIYHKIFQVDLDIKTGRLDPETALDLLIAEI